MQEAFKKAIESDMQQYAEELQAELTEKYNKEFEEKMSRRRNEIVLSAVESIKIEIGRDMPTNAINVLIKM